MRVIWRGLHPDLTSLEYLTLEPWSRATGTVIETGDAAGYAVRYEVDISPEGFPTHATFDLSDGRRFCLERTGAGVWWQDQQEKPEFAGCTDLDISATPLTNTLPLRRLGLDVGQTAEIEVVWVGLPEVVLRRTAQRYTRLSPSLYRYENLSSGYSNEVTLDADGLVSLYPDAFDRLELH